MATDFGVDADVAQTMGLSFGLALGTHNLGNAIARRWGTPRGGLAYDPDYGFDLRAYVNASLTGAQLSDMLSQASSEAEKDPRVLRCALTVTGTGTRQMTGTAVIDTEDGPFTLIVKISELTIDLLDASPAAAATPITSSTGITIITGASGPSGGSGPAGPPGTGTPSISLDQEAQMASSVGTEEVIYQALVDLTTLPGTITTELVGQIAVDAGNGTYRLRIGGSADPAVADGTVRATLTTASVFPTWVNASDSSSFANPSGLVRVKVTAQTSSAGNSARIRGITATIR